jgi:hypothetical protein
VNLEASLQGGDVMALVGETLERATGNWLPACVHRVVPREAHERYGGVVVVCLFDEEEVAASFCLLVCVHDVLLFYLVFGKQSVFLFFPSLSGCLWCFCVVLVLPRCSIPTLFVRPCSPNSASRAPPSPSSSEKCT